MAVRKIFTDSEGKELETFVNDKDKCYIAVGNLNDLNFDGMGYICLDIEDVSELIIELQFIKKQMEDNG